MSVLRSAGRVAVASSVHGRVQRRQSARWAAQEGASTAGPPPAPVAPPAAASVPPVPAAVAPAVPSPAVPSPEPAVPEAPSPEAPAPTGMAHRLEQLKLLGELRDAGVLTPAEFEAQKAQVLQS